MKRLLFFFWLLTAALPVAALEAGAAKAEITPPLGSPLNGYGDRLGRGAQSVHDPLWARCLFLSDGETELFLVNLDLCVITPELREAVLAVAPGVVPPEHIILTATHTHNATGGMTRHLFFRSISGPYRPELVELTADGVGTAMRQAYENRERATIGYGTASQDVLSVNRRVEDGPIDEQIGVIRVDDADGRAISIVTNFAAHPTTVDESDRYVISADFPGYYYAALEELTEEKCVPLFLNGAEGDQRCGNPEDKAGWERTESIGRLLAIRAKEVANRIECREETLRVGYDEVELPPTLATDWMPNTTIIQTLEVGRLLLCFFPGEPCVRLGLDLRQAARAAGYEAQFSVSLANDHLLYFVDHAMFRREAYETAMNVYGPDMNQWFQDAFRGLMTRVENPAEAPVVPGLALEEVPGGIRYALAGTAYLRGRMAGATFSETFRQRYEDLVAEPLRNRTWLPEESGWNSFPGFIDVSTLSAPLLATALRPTLGAVDDGTFEFLRGVTDGAQLPFDAVWLLQWAPTLAARGDIGDDLAVPFCTMVAVGGSTVSAETDEDAEAAPPPSPVMVGRNFDWPENELNAIVRVEPEEGLGYVEIAFPWAAGVYTGMNAAGVTLNLERVEAQGRPGLEGPPIDIILRDILATANTRAAAVEALRAAEHVHGYHVLVADAEGASIVEFGDRITVREGNGAILLGGDPAAERLGDNARARYERARSVFNDTDGTAREKLEAVLTDTADGIDSPKSVLSASTKHSVIFEPASRTAHVRLGTEPGRLGDVQTIRLDEPPTEAEAP